jgi:hypothetical protein
MTQSGETGSARAMELWLLPFAAMFTQPSRLNAVALATGALLCLNRRTVCGALRAVTVPRTQVSVDFIGSCRARRGRA